MKITPEKIKQLRQQLDISQQDFAILLGIALQTVHRWETGKNKPSRMAKNLLEKLFAEHNIE